MINGLKEIEEQKIVNKLKEQVGIEDPKINTFEQFYAEMNSRQAQLNASIETKYQEQIDINLEQQIANAHAMNANYRDVVARVKEAEEDLANKKNCFDFGYTYAEAVQLLRDNGKKLVLTDEDKEGILNREGQQFTSFDDFVLVHKTNYAPINNTIETAYSAYQRGTELKERNVTVNGQEYKYPQPLGRETIHFSVNGPVSNHLTGNDWDSMPYAIIIPFNKIDKERIGQALSVDTFINGSVELDGDCYILCPEEDVEKILSTNSNLKSENIIPYRNKDLTNHCLGYEHFVVSNICGCKPEIISNTHWINEEDDKKYSKMMNEHGLGTLLHVTTPEFKAEQAKLYSMIWVEIMKIIKKENLCMLPSDVDKVFNQIKSNISGNMDYSISGDIENFREHLNNEFDNNNIPRPISLTEEDIKVLNFESTSDSLQVMFRECFSDLYQPILDQEKQQRKQDIVEKFCDVIINNNEYGNVLEVINLEKNPVIPVNKPLNQLTLSDYDTIKKDFQVQVYLIATNPELQNKCNIILASQGIQPIVSNDKINDQMSPNEITTRFYDDCCQKINNIQINSEINNHKI